MDLPAQPAEALRIRAARERDGRVAAFVLLFEVLLDTEFAVVTPRKAADGVQIQVVEALYLGMSQGRERRGHLHLRAARVNAALQN